MNRRNRRALEAQSKTPRPDVKTKAHVFVAMPTGGGSVSNGTLQTLDNLRELLVGEGHGWDLLRASFSGIARTRNIMASVALETKATHFLFLDRDVVVDDANDLRTALFCDFDLVGIPYPKKQIHWDRVYAAAKQLAKKEAEGKPVSPDVLALAASYPVGIFAEPFEIKRWGGKRFLRALELGTGAMAIKMGALRAYVEEQAERLAYRTDYWPEPTEHYALFIDQLGPEPRDVRRFLTEDYSFTRQWNQSGREAWALIDAPTGQEGRWMFQCDLRAWKPEDEPTK